MPTLPWYKSNVLRGILAALVLEVARWLGVADKFDAEAVQTVVENLMHAFEFAALGFSAWSRARQPTPPITKAAAAKMSGGVVQSQNGG